MRSETKPAKNQEPAGSSVTTTQANDDVIEDIEIPQNKTLKDYGLQIMEGLACTRIGQYVTEITDKLLKILEQTAKWSLPQNDPEFDLIRPLPWIFFLTLMIWLRIIRIGLSIFGSVLGYQSVTPRKMVNFIQNKRRDVRAIRMHGLKAIHKKRLENQAVVMSGKNITFIGKLRNLLSRVICISGSNCEAATEHLLVELEMEQDTKEKTDEQPSTSKSSQDKDSSDLNLTVNQLLEKYAKVDSESDTDYIPKEEDEDDDDDDDDDDGDGDGDGDGDDENDVSATSSMSTEEVTLEENPEMSPETTFDAEESAIKDEEIKNADIKDKEIKDKEIKDADIKDDEIKANGDSKQQEKPMKEPLSDVETGNEQMSTPNEMPGHENGSSQPTEQLDNNGNSESYAESTSEVASENLSSTPKTKQEKHMAVPLRDEDEQKKSTPGHESAASVKLPFVGSTNKSGSPQDFPTTFYPTAFGKDSTAEDSHFSSSCNNENR